jgi:predicted double-glycine peptidase
MRRRLFGLALWPILLPSMAACKSPASTLQSAALAQESVQGGPSPSMLDLLTSANGASRWFVPVPLVRQQRNFTCGAAALMSVLFYYGDEVREGKLQRLLKSDKDNGTSYQQIVNLLTTMNSLSAGDREALLATQACEEDYSQASYPNCVIGVPAAVQANAKPNQPTTEQTYKVDLHPGLTNSYYPNSKLYPEEKGTQVPLDGLTMKQLEDSVRAGHPVIILMQAWTDSDPTTIDWYNDYDDGHYVVVNGFDANNIYMMDPSTTGTWGYVSRAQFAKRWHDEDTRPSNGQPCPAGSTPDSTGANCNFPVRHFGLIISRDYRGPAPFDFLNMNVPALN